MSRQLINNYGECHRQACRLEGVFCGWDRLRKQETGDIMGEGKGMVPYRNRADRSRGMRVSVNIKRWKLDVDYEEMETGLENPTSSGSGR